MNCKSFSLADLFSFTCWRKTVATCSMLSLWIRKRDFNHSLNMPYLMRTKVMFWWWLQEKADTVFFIYYLISSSNLPWSAMVVRKTFWLYLLYYSSYKHKGSKIKSRISKFLSLFNFSSMWHSICNTGNWLSVSLLYLIANSQSTVSHQPIFQPRIIGRE